MERKKLYIVGAGGFGREVAWLVERINEVRADWDLIGFVDDDVNSWGKLCGGYTVLGGTDFLVELDCDAWVVCAVGNPMTRKTIVEKMCRMGSIRFATLIDPMAICSPQVKIGEGSIVCAGSILTVNISIGNHVIINLDCTLGHDDMIEDYVTVYPSVNISGNVRVGGMTELGTGSKIIQGLDISSNVVLGAGSVVSKSLNEAGTYVGIPARKIK